MNEEQRAQIRRDEEIARQWDEEERQRAMVEAKSTKKIDWNDPSVIRYHALKMKPKTIAQARRNMIKYLKNQGNYKISDFKGMSYNEIRPIFEKVWDFNQHIEPMDMEHGSEKMKSPEKIEEKDDDTQKEMKEVVKESGAKRKKSLPKNKEDYIIPREDVAEDVESLSTKYPIVDWKTYTLTENFMYYQIFRGDGSSKNYKVLSEMLEDFDRQDVEELYRLVKERYSASRPEGYDLMLWGDLHTLFEPDEEDEIWKNQHEYNKIPPRRATGEDENPPDIATLFAQQLQNLLPEIVNQVTASVNANANNGNGNGANGGNERMKTVIDNSGCAENQKVRYVASSLVKKALTWWNTQVQARSREAENAMSWNDFKALLVEEFCPSNEMERLEMSSGITR
ncbi:hypothetical protein Tco_1005728 [Tanacetum coccineum]|uniref:Reverse transcriptase domain-containing protein n=1 Tax=Tanacetum coccineum TaxID=301880 RepID=A0ABQ5FFU3_9ASTR